MSMLEEPTAPTQVVTVALSALQSWAAQALNTVSDLIRPTPTRQPRSSLNDQLIHRTLTTLSTLPTTSTASIAALTTAAAVVLSVLFFVFRYLMGDRRSFGWAGGRGSPFLSEWNDPQGNLLNHFEYIEPDENLYSGHRPSTVRSAYGVRDEREDPKAPDVIHVTEMGRTFSIDFPPYAINEEKASVRELRRCVAERLGTTADRVRLIYKGREVRRNAYSLRKYQMKQNSEVWAIVTDRPSNYEQDRDSGSETGSDSDSGTNRAIRHRGDEAVAQVQANGNGFLSPTSQVPSTPVDRRPRDTLRPSEAQHRDSLRPSSRGPDYRDSDHRREQSVQRDGEVSQSRGPSTARAQSTSRDSSSTPQLRPADPNTPLGKIQGLLSTLSTVWVPQCTRFIVGPPSHPEVRKKEYLKLSESVMQLVDKADAIDLEGNAEARSLRKGLINEAYAVVKKLDAVPK
ncbi:hypothetical protein DV736_g4229, partial [Chaetothyriales sp. CBS 134916]